VYNLMLDDVIPLVQQGAGSVKTGIQKDNNVMDSRLRGNDKRLLVSGSKFGVCCNG